MKGFEKSKTSMAILVPFNLICILRTSTFRNTTLIIPISMCYYSELHNAMTIWWECGLLPSKVIYGL